jgi:hypothetical protein
MAKKTDTERLLDDLDKLNASGRITVEEYNVRRSAILSGAVAAPAEKSRGGGIFKWGMFGCLGIFVVIGLLVIILIVAIGAALNDAADKAEDSGGDVRVALANGASGEIAPEANGSKRSRVTILRFVDNVQSNNQFLTPAEGKKWVGFEVVIENVGTAQVTSLGWTLRDSKSIEHERAYVVGASGSQVDVVYSDLTPGGKKQGWVYFEIDADASVAWLRADPNPFLAHDLYFDAQ